jgi:hypothetical protein
VFRRMCLLVLILFGMVGAFFNFNKLFDTNISLDTFTTMWWLRSILMMLISLIGMILFIRTGGFNGD